MQLKLRIPDIKLPTIALIIIIITIIKDASRDNTPNIVAIVKGTVVKATIPSIAYLNSFQNDHFVTPSYLIDFHTLSILY